MTLAFSSTDDLLQQIGESVEEGLSNIDFSPVEQASSPFLQNFADCMRRVINGEFTSADGYFQALLSLFNQSLAEILPSLAAVFCIVVICGVARSMSDGLISPDTANAVSFVGVAVTVFSLCALAASLYRQVSDMVNSVAALSQAAMPVLLTLVIAGGGSAVSVGMPTLYGSVFLRHNTVRAVVSAASVGSSYGVFRRKLSFRQFQSDQTGAIRAQRRSVGVGCAVHGVFGSHFRAGHYGGFHRRRFLPRRPLRRQKLRAHSGRVSVRRAGRCGCRHLPYQKFLRGGVYGG